MSQEKKVESTRAILNKGYCQVQDKGNTWIQDLPVWMNLSNETLENLGSIIDQIGEERVLALVHKGLVQAIIDVRAKARAKDKDGQYTGNPQAYEPSPLPAPGKSKAEKALEDLTPEQLQQLLERKGLA